MIAKILEGCILTISRWLEVFQGRMPFADLNAGDYLRTFLILGIPGMLFGGTEETVRRRKK